MRTVKTLIDEAAQVCGGYSKLAKRVGVSPQRISDYRHERQQVTPETLGQLCDIAQLDGEEARRLLAVLVVSNPKNADRVEVLRRAFFVSLVLGVVLALQETPNDVTSATVVGLTVYTLWRVRTGFPGRENSAGSRRQTPLAAIMAWCGNPLRWCQELDALRMGFHPIPRA